MTKPEQKALGEYVRLVADMLELRDWTIELSEEPAPADSYGHITNTYGRKLAVLKLAPDFRSLTASQQRHTVVHELVHCHLESATNMVLNDLESHLAKQADQLFWEGFKRQIEYGVDALASAIAKQMPLIVWPKK